MRSEIAQDEIAHVTFLRTALGTAAVAQPADRRRHRPDRRLQQRGAARPGWSRPATAFDPYASDDNFLLGAFIFEDVGVTAYKGASPLLTNKTYLEAAAGILAVEAYHAAIVRTALYAKGVATPALTHVGRRDLQRARQPRRRRRDDRPGHLADSPASTARRSNIVPLDANGIAYSRSTGQVLNIVYLNNAAVTHGRVLPGRCQRHHQDQRRATDPRPPA